MDVEIVCDNIFDSEGLADDVRGCHGCSFVLGAAVAFGLMGMAEAIRENAPRYEPDECNNCDAPLVVVAIEEWGTFGTYCSPRCLDEAKERMAKNLGPRSWGSRSTTGEGG